MRTFIIKSLFILAAFIAIQGCKKDAPMVTSAPGKPSALTASATSVVLNSEIADDQAIEFTWSKADYGFNAAIQYSVQMDKKGNNFASPREFSIDPTAALQRKFTVAEINNALIMLKLTPGESAEVEVRVKSELRSNVDTIFSNVVTFTATPYAVTIFYPSLYVSGAFQGWTVSNDYRIADFTPSKDNIDSDYEGYIYFSDASKLGFKYTTDDKWTTTYGWASSTNTDSWSGGTFAAAAGGDLFVPSTGYYQLKADTKTNVWSAQKAAFSIVGDATPGGWEGDTDMAFDATTKEWKVTANLVAGKFKFRANHAWVIDYGNNATPNGFLVQGGKDIPIEAAGRYTIVLNLSNPGNYTFSITKL